MVYKIMGASCVKKLISIANKMKISPQLAMIKGLSREALEDINKEAIHQKMVILAMSSDIMDGLQEAPRIASIEPSIVEVEENVFYTFFPMSEDSKFGVRIARRNAIIEGRPERNDPIDEFDEKALKQKLNEDVDVVEIIKNL